MFRSNVSARLLAVTVFASMAAAACFEIDAFECGSDEACTRDGTAGRCEVEGVCAYPSDDCTSSWQYSPNAGSLAGTCVPARGDTDASSGGGSSTSTTGDARPTCPGCQAYTLEGRAFFVCASSSTWFDARDACTACGLALASVRNDAENQALAQRVPEAVQLWVGLSDAELEGTWRWQDGAALDHEPWAEGEPSTVPEDDCAVLVSSGEWFARRCDVPNPYACAEAP